MCAVPSLPPLTCWPLTGNITVDYPVSVLITYELWKIINCDVLFPHYRLPKFATVPGLGCCQLYGAYFYLVILLNQAFIKAGALTLIGFGLVLSVYR